jgi:hypothetical protein
VSADGGHSAEERPRLVADRISLPRRRLPPGALVLFAAPLLLAVVLAGILAFPRANESVNCGCQDTFLRSLPVLEASFDPTSGFGQSAAALAAKLNAANLPYFFTPGQSRNVDEVSVAVGGPSPLGNRWAALAVRGAGGCYELIVVRAGSKSPPLGDLAATDNLLEETYAPSPAGTCQARFDGGVPRKAPKALAHS